MKPVLRRSLTFLALLALTALNMVWTCPLVERALIPLVMVVNEVTASVEDPSPPYTGFQVFSAVVLDPVLSLLLAMGVAWLLLTGARIARR